MNKTTEINLWRIWITNKLTLEIILIKKLVKRSIKIQAKISKLTKLINLSRFIRKSKDKIIKNFSKENKTHSKIVVKTNIIKWTFSQHKTRLVYMIPINSKLKWIALTNTSKILTTATLITNCKSSNRTVANFSICPRPIRSPPTTFPTIKWWSRWEALEAVLDLTLHKR